MAQACSMVLFKKNWNTYGKILRMNLAQVFGKTWQIFFLGLLPSLYPQYPCCLHSRPRKATPVPYHPCPNITPTPFQAPPTPPLSHTTLPHVKVLVHPPPRPQEAGHLHRLPPRPRTAPVGYSAARGHALL